jgi:hypothetical protein
MDHSTRNVERPRKRRYRQTQGQSTMKRLFLLLALCAPIHAAKYCVVFVPDMQNLTAVGGNGSLALSKMFTWIQTQTSSTFGCTLEAVVGEGDQINTVCGAVSGTKEELLAFSKWNLLSTKWTVSFGNHEYDTCCATRVYSEDWKDAPNSGTCAGFPTPGNFSPEAFVARANGFTSTAQFWGASGVNANSWLMWTPSGYHSMAILNLNFFATQTELNSAAVLLTANPHTDVHLVTHAAMAPTDNTAHAAQYQGYTCTVTPYCNANYSLDASNSRSGAAILSWAQGFPNIVDITNGHYFPTGTADGNWSTRTDNATDGHQINGVHADWQNLDVAPHDSTGTVVALSAGGGTCPDVGSTGCTAEVGFVMPLVIDTTAHTASYYALSTNTGHWVATGNALPQAGNTMTPIATFTYAGTPGGLFPLPSPTAR